jgi:membrane associated rhomboid family serine protease
VKLARRPTSSTELSIRGELKLQAKILVSYLGLLWGLELVDSIALGGFLDQFGIHPRTLQGLWGILLAPLLHGGLGHLAANSVPLLVLGWFVMLRNTRDFFTVGAITTVVGGLGIWLIGGAHTVHLGASIIIFGFLGYLLLRGYFDRKLWSIAGSVVVGLLYGGMVLGVLPGQAGISWEGHLFGFVGGTLSAYLLRARTPGAPLLSRRDRPGLRAR